MTEELNNSANNDARPVDPLDAAIEAALESSEPEPEKKEEETKQEAPEENDSETPDDTREDGDIPEDEPEPEKIDKTATAPEHWPAEDKALLENIKDDEARKLVMQIDKRLQAAHTRRSQELSEQVKTADTIKKTFEPFQADLRAAGLNETTAVDALIREYQTKKQFEVKLQQNPKEVIADLAKQYGVSLDGLNDEDAYKDPYVVQLEQKVAQLEGKVGSVADSFQNERNQIITQQIEQFSKATNEDGSLKHPHFERLRTAMGNFMTSNSSETLSTAYEKAMRADPELYQEILAREVQAKLKEQERERNRKADLEKAKKAKRSLNVNGSAAKAPMKTKSLDDAFNAAAEKYGLL